MCNENKDRKDNLYYTLTKYDTRGFESMPAEDDYSEDSDADSVYHESK